MGGVVRAVPLREGTPPPQQGMLLLTLSQPSPHPSAPFLAPGASRIRAHNIVTSSEEAVQTGQETMKPLSVRGNIFRGNSWLSVF